MSLTESTPGSHMAAGRLMIDAANDLLTAWDGTTARTYGDTAKAVAYAREHHPMWVIWPEYWYLTG
ncbi:MAG TPA: hypothetical protein VGM53_08455 [Streptosporangiaceae bacterium]|jgi:hypothetical protein